MKSSFTDLFIKRPVLAIVVNLVIVIAGLQAYRSLNVRQYPRSDNATVTVASDDVEKPTVTVDLTGQGAVPELQIDPDPLEL